MAQVLAARREQRVEVRGLLFRYWELGASTAEPIVLLHALGAGADDWAEIAAGLADRWRAAARAAAFRKTSWPRSLHAYPWHGW